MEWLVMIVLVAAGGIGGYLLMSGKRDPQTRNHVPGVFRHPGSHFESNRRHGDKKPAKSDEP